MEEVLGEFSKKLALDDVSVVEVALHKDQAIMKRKQFFLVGELLTSKRYQKESLISTIRGLWCPKLCTTDKSHILSCSLEGSNQILFSFKFETDLKWVVKNCTWTFDKSLFFVAVKDGLVEVWEKLWLKE